MAAVGFSRPSSLPGAQNGPAATPVDSERASRERMAKTLLWGYIGATVVVLVTRGIPFDRRFTVMWIIAAMAINALGKSRREAGMTIVRWVPFLAAVVAHDLGGSFADNFGRKVVVNPQLHFDKWLFGGTAPTTWFQHHLHRTGQVRWFDAVVAIIYLSHFVAPYAVAAFLWKRDRSAWKRYTAVYFFLAAAAFVTFALYPTAPPWMAADRGLLPPTPRLVSDGWQLIGAKAVSFLVVGGQKAANDVAAIPSLHGAHSLLVVWFLWSRVRKGWRPWLVLYPVAMLFCLVYGGEHYVADVLVGWAYLAIVAVSVNAVANRLSRTWAAAKSERDHRTQNLAPFHLVEGGFDAVDADSLAHEPVQVEAALQIEVDEHREVAARQAVAVPT